MALQARSFQVGWMARLSLQASPSADQAAVARFRAALAAREEVEAHLESELAAARAQAASYEHRWSTHQPLQAPSVLPRASHFCY